MVFSTRWAPRWLAVAVVVSCSVDERIPTVKTTPVMPPCDDGACVEPDTTPDVSGPAPACDNDGGLCDDGQFCTVGDACDEGACRGAVRDCDDGVACTVGDSCDEGLDQCALGAAQCPEDQVCGAASGECGTTCSGCVVANICHADGAANPVNPCELCDVAASADAFTPAGSAVSCDDGVACTENDSCGNGTCSGAPVACAADQLCVESTGLCEAVAGYALALEVASVQVVQGSSVSVSLSLVRDDEHVLPVDVTVLGLPPGVNAEALELSDSEDFATLTLNVAAQAAEGVRTLLTVRTSDGFNVVTQPLELFVRGEAGSLDLSFGNGGRATAAPPGAPGFQGTRVVVDGDDRILVAATSRFVLDPLNVPARASLTRLSSNGAVDAGFADGGTYLETPGSDSLREGPTTFLGGVALAPGGYVLAGPLGEGIIQEASYVTRLDAAGNRAADFAAPTLGSGLRLTDVAVENGTLFAVGQTLGNAALYRSDLSGANALRFTEPAILASMQAVFWSPADNEFILAGNCDPNACFARLNDAPTPPQLSPNRVTNLSPDTASILDATADAQGRYFAIASGGNLVRFVPEALRPPGALNLTVVVDDLGNGGRSAQGIELSGDRLYVAAALPDPTGETGIPAVVRYSTSWARDSSFGAGGVAPLDGAVEVGSSVDVAVQADGRVIVATVDGGDLVVYRVWD